jgi:hypothetical protein
MSVILELFSPVPIVALAVAVFGLILVWALSRYFRMPAGFRLKEEFRDEVRYMLINEEISKVAREKVDAEKAAAEAAEEEMEKEKERKKREAAERAAAGGADAESAPTGVKKAAVGGGKKG